MTIAANPEFGTPVVLGRGLRIIQPGGGRPPSERLTDNQTSAANQVPRTMGIEGPLAIQSSRRQRTSSGVHAVFEKLPALSAARTQTSYNPDCPTGGIMAVVDWKGSSYAPSIGYIGSQTGEVW